MMKNGCEPPLCARSLPRSVKRALSASDNGVALRARSTLATVPGFDHEGPVAVFVLEQTLGHVTHAGNLRTLIPQVATVRAHFVAVPFETSAHRVPVWSNWTVRAGIHAAHSIHALRRAGVRPDVMFVHSQVPAVLLGPWMRRIPTVVSLDATPKQYDELGEFYAHEPGPAVLERFKDHLNRTCFERAVHLVTWSEWARGGLITGYGIDPDRITAIAPGVDVDRWRRTDRRPVSDAPVRILFVGGDLQRKGGDLLIEAARMIRSDSAAPELEVHIVSDAKISPDSGLVVHRGLTPNSAELIAQYHAADIFCLPTRGDCLPMVLAEAAAASLPIVSTDVGAIQEIVENGVTGTLIPPGDVHALAGALRELIADPQLRHRRGDAARDRAERKHDARRNVQQLVGLMGDVARK
jgi:glycosyltransferase involved in cell wall biosynthesis